MRNGSAKRVLIPFRNAAKVGPYVAAAGAGGMEGVAEPVHPGMTLEGFSGLILAGGTDVNPRRYHAVPRAETDSPDDERDEVEWNLLAEAMEQDLPVFAICRGLQLLNAYRGGTLIQHLTPPELHDQETADKGAPAHDVELAENSLIEELAGTRRLRVNSRHHQAIDRVGSNLAVSARAAEDGTIEAVDDRSHRFLLAVQWHPEDQVGAFPEQLRLFQSFAAALE